jgi:membrane associated rhomboid family serine protease
MFFPLYDRNPLKVIRFQTVTAALVAANVLVFLYSSMALDDVHAQRFYLAWGMVPAVLTGKAVLAPALARVPAILTPLTSLFVHGGWMHLIGNMAFLWVFADNVEDGFGHWRFLLFYLFCGLVAGLAHVLVDPASQVPLVGASGAISGIVASYLLLFPRTQVLSLFGVFPVNLPALWLLLAWLAFNVLSFLASPTGEGVAWSAHIGGFAAGFVITWLFRDRIRLRLARGAALKRQQAQRQAQQRERQEA